MSWKLKIDYTLKRKYMNILYMTIHTISIVLYIVILLLEHENPSITITGCYFFVLGFMIQA